MQLLAVRHSDLPLKNTTSCLLYPSTLLILHLVVVDCQHDFCHLEGALYVPQGECAVEKNR